MRRIGARVDASRFPQPGSNHSFSKLRVASDISGGTEFRKAFSVQLAEDGVNLLTLGTYVKLLVIFVVMTTLPLLPTSIPRAHANLAPSGHNRPDRLAPPTHSSIDLCRES